MFRKKDVIIIAVLLLIAALAYGGIMLSRQGQTLSDTVQIYAGNELYATASLSQDQEIHIEQENGYVNVVSIEHGGVKMLSSSCKNQLCVHQGTVTEDNWMQRSMGRSIVCLPNSVLVELALDDGHPSLEMEDLPDI